MSNSPRTVLILGSGVIGMTVAHVLAHHPSTKYEIKVVARDMSEDLDSQAFASPWAGASCAPIGGFDERIHVWEKATFNKLWDMVPTGLSMVLPSRMYYPREQDLSEIWYKDLFRNVMEIPKHALPPTAKAGVTFDTVSVNPAVYLPWIKSELLSKGVEFIRKKVISLDELPKLVGEGAIVVNATGLGARSIHGVEDFSMYPIRGQTITVHAPEITEFITTDDLTSEGEVTYIIPRPSPPGSVLLGGTYQIGNWDPSLDGPTARGILERCSVLAPSLADINSETRIVSHNVGFRPARKGGPRVETELVRLPVKSAFKLHQVVARDDTGNPWKVVHAYGFGGIGYQSSWGVAQEVARLVEGS